jgi:hypothetical protein
MTLADAASRTTVFVRATAEPTALGETQARVFTATRTITDGAALGESLSRAGLFVRGAGDAMSLADANSGTTDIPDILSLNSNARVTITAPSRALAITATRTNALN